MQREMKSARSTAERKTRSGSGELSPGIAELGARFARFRAAHPRGTRFPEELRRAAVAAWAQGVKPSELERACRVTWNQLEAWRSREQRELGDESPGEDVRVFTVVDETQRPPAGPLAEGVLELRLGAWSVSVRLAERG